MEAISKTNRQEEREQANTQMVGCQFRWEGGSKSEPSFEPGPACRRAVCKQLRPFDVRVPKMLNCTEASAIVRTGSPKYES